MIATCGSDLQICLFDVRNTKVPIFVNKESKDVVTSVEFTNDQRFLMSTTFSGVFNMMDLKTQKMILANDKFGPAKTWESNAMHASRSVRGHKDGNLLMIGGEN